MSEDKVQKINRVRVFMIGTTPGVSVTLDLRQNGLGQPTPCWPTRETATAAARVLSSAQNRQLGVFPAYLQER